MSYNFVHKLAETMGAKLTCTNKWNVVGLPMTLKEAGMAHLHRFGDGRSFSSMHITEVESVLLAMRAMQLGTMYMRAG